MCVFCVKEENGCYVIGVIQKNKYLNTTEVYIIEVMGIYIHREKGK